MGTLGNRNPSLRGSEHRSDVIDLLFKQSLRLGRDRKLEGGTERMEDLRGSYCINGKTAEARAVGRVTAMRTRRLRLPRPLSRHASFLQAAFAWGQPHMVPSAQITSKFIKAGSSPCWLEAEASPILSKLPQKDPQFHLCKTPKDPCLKAQPLPSCIFSLFNPVSLLSSSACSPNPAQYLSRPGHCCQL